MTVVGARSMQRTQHRQGRQSTSQTRPVGDRHTSSHMATRVMVAGRGRTMVAGPVAVVVVWRAIAMVGG